VSLGVRLSCCVYVRRSSLGIEGNALYPVLSGLTGQCFQSYSRLLVGPAKVMIFAVRQKSKIVIVLVAAVVVIVHSDS